MALDPTTAERVAAAADAVVKKTVGDGTVMSGVVAGVTDTDRDVYLGAAGRSSLAEDTPIATDAVFAIFSTTKALTGTAALQLWEAGELDLDAPAKEYAPGLADVQVIDGFDDGGEPILRAPASDPTTRQLLLHTAGFGYDFFNENYLKLAERGHPSVVSATHAALRSPLLFDPGTQWEYGSNIDWAGQVVEGITGKRLGEVLSERVLAPLDMSDTSFTATPDQLARHATMHQRDEGDLVATDFALPNPPEVDMGGHGLHSTVADYLKFIRLWLGDGRAPGGEQVLRTETIEYAVRNHLGELKIKALPGVIPSLSNDAEFFPGQPKSWALTFMVNDEDAPTGRPAGSIAWAGLANLYYWIDRRNGIGGYWATQILPFADPASVGGYLEFETATYDALRG